MKQKAFFLLIVLTAFAFFSCEQTSTRFEIRLTDAPASYDAVNIDIQGIEYNTSGSEENGWKELEMERPGIYNLLDFSGGLDTVLVNQEFDPISIQQIRLILGDDNSVVIDSTEYDLKVPSSSTSGLKINVHAQLQEGITYKLLLDFDAAKSVHESSAGKWILKPVIRSIVEAESGSIKGIVKPDTLDVVAYAITGEDTISAYANDLNVFLIRGVLQGTYKVVVDAAENGMKEIEDVEVTTGNVTDLGEIVFELNEEPQ